MHHSLPGLCAMWTAMSVVMMAPLAGRRAPRFLAGFLAPWIAYGLAAAVLQFWLQDAGLVDHASMSLASPIAGAALLLVAGALQFSPMKRACLARCREAAEPTARAGLRRGVHSIGCCGVPMLALLAVGVMNFPAMIGLTILMMLEQWMPRAEIAAGVVFCAAAFLEVL
jgi:predicted metal-binding membrane protein